MRVLCSGKICRKISSVSTEGFRKSVDRKNVPKHGALLFIGACGIAVRSIAPYLQGKDKDPAVVVLDERGIFAISLLSGHLGGANELTAVLANLTGAIPVITTATDINGRFAVDVFAKSRICGSQI